MARSHKLAAALAASLSAPIAAQLAASMVLALGACKSLDAPTPVLSESAVTLDLPIVRQDELYDCGLAAISALCQYWSVEIPPERRSFLAARAKEKEGLSGTELRETLEELGLETFLFSGTLDRSETGLFRHVDAGRPLLVMLGTEKDSHHYCLFLGYDEPRKNTVLLDPARGPVVRPLEVFARDWERCRRFTLLACPHGADPAVSAPAGGVAGAPVSSTIAEARAAEKP